MRVLVKNMRGESLIPCSNRKARLLLQSKKAKIISYTPFAIQLLYATGEATQEIYFGNDTGAKHHGFDVTTNDKVIIKGTIHYRDDVKENIASRRTLRRNRRSRNTRYRRCKFKYHTKRMYDQKKQKWVKKKIRFTSPRPDGWLPPSIQNRVDHTIRFIQKMASFLPNPIIRVEVGKFDIQKMENPSIQGKEYQQGNAYGFWSTRYYVFARDNYTCQLCKKKGGILHTHHIIERHDGGSDKADNLATVHNECHQKFHQGEIKHTFKKPKEYKEPTFMNILRKRILQSLDCKITYGNITTVERKRLKLSKSHANDAIAIANPKRIREYRKCGFLEIKQFRMKKRSLHESVARKGRKTKNTESKRNNKNTPSSNGWYLNDKVEAFGKKGYITGFTGKMVYVQDMEGNYITNPSKNYKQINMTDITLICHNNNWQSSVSYE